MTLRICYNTAINACAQSGEWEIALGLSDEMRLSVLGEGARPDAFTFNSIMHGMASVGECERLLSVLGGMRAAGVPPDVVSYNTAMGACIKVGGWTGSQLELRRHTERSRTAAFSLKMSPLCGTRTQQRC